MLAKASNVAILGDGVCDPSQRVDTPFARSAGFREHRALRIIDPFLKFAQPFQITVDPYFRPFRGHALELRVGRAAGSGIADLELPFPQARPDLHGGIFNARRFMATVAEARFSPLPLPADSR